MRSRGSRVPLRSKSFLTIFLLVVVALGTATAPAHAEEWRAHHVPLFVSASHPSGHQGFVRVVNHSAEAGEVVIDAVDDDGVPSGPVTFRIGAEETVHFNSGDLENGNAEKDLSAGIGSGTGDWRLRLRSALDLEVLAYNRTSDGMLAGLHDLVPRAVVRRPGGGGESMGHRVAIFNPASNVNQVSRLRIVNRGDEPAEVTIEGIDDDGASPGTAVELAVPAGATRMVTSQELESGQGEGLVGMLGDGRGKWQLVVTSDEPVEVMSLMTSPTGHLTNLSTAPAAGEGTVGEHAVPLFAANANPDGYQGFVRVINRSSADGEVSIEAFDDAGTDYGPVTIDIGAHETVHFNSGDLEDGNADKGLPPGIEPGAGDWRLRLRSELDLEVLAYNRTADGLLASLHDVVPYTDMVRPGARDEVQAHYVAIFNPGSNANQVSRLRVINPGEEAATVTIEGFGDDGVSPGPGVELEVPSGASRTLSARALESGEWGPGIEASGSLGDGRGKWRLLVTSSQAVEVMSLLASPTGHLINLSTAGPAGEVVPEPAIAPGAAIEVTGRTTASEGMPVALRARSVGADVPIERYDWRFSDGQRRSGEEVSVSFTTAGVHEVTVRAVSGLDVVAQASWAVAVFDDAAGVNPGLEGIPRVFGDVDQDGRFGPEDLALAEEAVAGERELEAAAVEAGDLNLSGSLDARDIEWMTQALDAGAALPSALLEAHSYPGGVAALVSPALLDPDTEVEVFVDGTPSPRVMRAILGYATFVVPGSLTGANAEVEVAVGADGVVAERLPLLLKPVVTPADMTPAEDVLAFFEELVELLSSQEAAGESFFEQNGGLSAGDTAIVLGGSRVAARELASALSELEALLSGPGGEELATALQAALYANGLAEFRTSVRAARGEGEAPGPSSALAASASGVAASSVDDVCDRYVPAICALKDTNAVLSIGTEVATGVCAVVGLASFATANPLVVAGVAKLCAPVLAALGAAQTAGYFVDSISLDVRLGADKTALRGTEDTATISAFVTFSGLQELCGTATSSDYAGDIVGWVAAGIVRLLLKKSVLLSKSHRILERKSLEKFIATTFGSVLGAVLTTTGLDRAFAEGARALCHYVGFGLTDAELRFSARAAAGEFNLRVSNGGALTPKNDGSGTYRLACAEGFTGTLSVAGNKSLCGEDKLDAIRVSCSNPCDLAPDEEVNIPDARLRAVIERSLGEGPITRVELERLTSLRGHRSSFPSGIIRSLAGLECATGLTDVNLWGNEITDISPLFAATALFELDISENQVVDLSPLSGATALTRLHAYDNRITDLSPLSGVPNLATLSLGSNRITDLAPLSELSALIFLALEENRIADISPLSGLTGLVVLRMSGNEIADSSPLSGLTALRHLVAGRNRIASISLSGFSSLREMHLSENRIASVSLSDMPALEWVLLNDNRVASLSFSGLPSLRSLDANNNQLTNISALSSLPALCCAQLNNNRISDIGPLVANPALVSGQVQFRENPLGRTSCLTHIPALQNRGVSVVYDRHHCGQYRNQ